MRLVRHDDQDEREIDGAVRWNTIRPKLLRAFRWPGRWGPQGMSKTGGSGPARVPNLRVCCVTLGSGVAHAGGDGRETRPAVVPSSRRGNDFQ